MNRSRPLRSKTGCQTCRRRKVRCDEKKPICSACTRLSLDCSYEPGAAPTAAGSARYQVRFISSPYTKLQQKGDKSTNKVRPDISQSSDRDTTSQNEHHEESLSGDARQSFTLEPVAPTAGPSHHGLPPQSPQRFESFGCGPQLDAPEASLVAGHLPTFFDLNLNFELLGYEWLTSTETPGDTSTSNSLPCEPDVAASIPPESSVIIGQEDHRLIQHYLSVMTGYAKLRSSGDDNIYSQIFSSMALFYPPLYSALMAWTALHLGQTSAAPDLVRKADERYAHAISLMHQDRNVAIHFELSLVTIWFALQFELLAARGIEAFVRHLDFAADLVDAHRRHQKTSQEAMPLGSIVCHVLVWLAAYDARASWIGGSGRLLQNLELFSPDYGFIDAAFPDAAVRGASAELRSCLRLSLELDTVEGRIVHLHRRAVVTPVAVWASVQSDLISLGERLESDSTVAPFVSTVSDLARSVAGKITTARFNTLLLLASFYSIVITFHRMVPAMIATTLPMNLTTAESAATSIVRISSWVCRFRSPSPQNIWPRILFMAGIETTDIVYQDWVVKTLVEADRWGVNIRKTRVLLEKVIKMQSRKGSRVDYLDVMKQSTGLFIV